MAKIYLLEDVESLELYMRQVKPYSNQGVLAVEEELELGRRYKYFMQACERAWDKLVAFIPASTCPEKNKRAGHSAIVKFCAHMLAIKTKQTLDEEESLFCKTHPALFSNENEEETTLLCRTVVNSYASAQIPKHELITKNLRWVVSIARRYRGKGLSFLHLIQEGNKGLILAAQGFNPELGNRFITYATSAIKDAIIKALTNDSRPVRITPSSYNLVKRAKVAEEELQASLDHMPTLEDIVQHMHILDLLFIPRMNSIRKSLMKGKWSAKRKAPAEGRIITKTAETMAKTQAVQKDFAKKLGRAPIDNEVFEWILAKINAMVVLRHTAENLLYQKLKRKPKLGDVTMHLFNQMHMGLKEKVLARKVKTLSGAQQAMKTMRSLDVKPSGNDEDDSSGDLMASNGQDPSAALILPNSKLMEVMQRALDEREYKIICWRRGLGGNKPKTLKEIANELGITKEWVRQLEIGVLRKLKSPEVRESMVDYVDEERLETIAT